MNLINKIQNMKKNSFNCTSGFFILLIFFSVIIDIKDCFSQSKVYLAVKMPKKYLMPNGEVLGKVSSSERDPTVNEGTWIVFADRDNDTVYQDKNLAIVKTQVEFMERLFVVDETEFALRVVRYQSYGTLKKEKGGTKLIVDDYDDLGWMPKKKLLLWQTSIIDIGTNFVKKAVPVQRLKEGDSDSKAAADRLRKGKGICDFYPSPTAATFDTLKDVNYFNYLFVFKEENGRVLLSKKNDVDVGNIANNIYGWVPKSQIHLWNNSVCLRINYSSKAIAEREKKGVEPKFFPNYTAAANFESGDFTEKGATPELSKEGETQHESSYILGFPIISTKEELKSKRIVKSGYITNVKDKFGKNIYSTDGKARIDSILAQLRDRMNRVNVVFVLDGSLRGKYFGPVASSIDNLIGLEKGFTSSQYNWGAVIYNDQSCSELIQLSNSSGKSKNKDGIVSWIKQQINSAPCGEINRKDGAPIFEAMKKAEIFFDGNRSSNMVIVIGTSGEEMNSSQLESLKQSYNKLDISMTVFQVENRGGAVYEDFYESFRTLMIEVAKDQEQELKEKYKNYASLPPVKLKLIGDSRFKLENTSVPGTIIFSSEGKPIIASEIQSKIKSHLYANQERLGKLIAKLDDGRSGSNRDIDYTVDQKKELILYMLGVKSLKEEDINILSSLDNIQLFIEAFTVLEFAPNVGVNEPLLVRSLFMSSLEFANLKQIVDKLNDAGMGNTREKLSNAIKQIQLNYIGGSINSRQYPIGEILKMATGVPSYNKALKFTADDFLDERKVDAECLSILLEDFSKMQAKLEMVEKSTKYYNNRYGEKFYWIPEEYLYITENCSKQSESVKPKKKK